MWTPGFLKGLAAALNALLIPWNKRLPSSPFIFVGIHTVGYKHSFHGSLVHRTGSSGPRLVANSASPRTRCVETSLYLLCLEQKGRNKTSSGCQHQKDKDLQIHQHSPLL